MSPSATTLSRFGIAIGHATDEEGGTGLTVIRGIKEPLRGACLVMGRATGSRELALLEPGHLVERVDAVMLSGGSAYGLDAAAGVMRWMEEKGRGFPVGPGVVPIVPSAVIFDLLPCGSFDARPTAEMAYTACEKAKSSKVAEGSIGAGTGATVGKLRGAEGAMKGGVGVAVVEDGGRACCAIAVVNAFGDVRDGEGKIIAGARRSDGGFVDTVQAVALGARESSFVAGTTTTLVVVAFDAAYSRAELKVILDRAGEGLLARVTPAATRADGDIIFGLAPMDGPMAPRLQGERLARAAVEQAIERGVRKAKGRDGIPGLADR